MAKRKAPADVTEDVDAGTSKQQKKDGQKAISKNLKVPLDELFPLQRWSSVESSLHQLNSR